MTREEAVKRLKERIDRQALLLDDEDMAALTELVPELAESEDERIRKHLVAIVEMYWGKTNDPDKAKDLAYLEKQKECVADSSKTSAGEDERIRRVMLEHFKSKTKETWCGLSVANIIAWLEKKKELFESGRGLYYYDGEKTIYCGYPAMEENPYDFAISQQEKQKEQKPDDDPLNDPKFLKGFDTGREVQRIFDEKKPAEWSEEDEYRRQQAINALDRNGYYVLVDWLKSLRPQSKDEIYKEKDEAFKFGKHQLAINFINYLDENRPEGKMSLSSDECEDIVRAFKENDWAKIMRYVEKYRPSWKPSEEQMEALLNAEKYLNAGLQYGSATRIAELYEQLKKL